MPRFYFDSDDGLRHFRDEHGVELPSLRDVPDEAWSLLRDFTHAPLVTGRRVMTTKVRDKAGTLVYRAEMTIVGEARIEGRNSLRCCVEGPGEPEPHEHRGV